MGGSISSYGLSDLKHVFPYFLKMYDIDIAFRSIAGSMAVFDFNSTSKIENLLFFLYIWNTFRPFFSKNRLNVIFWHEHEWRFLLIFHDFIYVSLFQSKSQN